MAKNIPTYIYSGTESNISYENWPNAADDNVYTKYCGAFHSYAYFLFDANELVMPYGYRIYTANDTQVNSGRNPSSWRLYGSNTYTEDPDDECWELIDEQTNNSTLQAVNYTPFDFTLIYKDEETSLDEELRMKNEGSDGAIYDLSGRKINSQFSTLNSQLPKGIYIVNGKKVVSR